MKKKRQASSKNGTKSKKAWSQSLCEGQVPKHAQKESAWKTDAV